MDMPQLVTRLVLLPLEAASFGANVLAQSTHSAHKMAEESVRKLMGNMGEEAADYEAADYEAADYEAADYEDSDAYQDGGSAED